MFVDNPELVIDDVEKIFLLKDIPIVGKLYLTFEKLHPNFSGYNKIFDEDYVAKLDILSLNERYELYLKQIDWINYSGNHLIYSY